ncbi:zf-GRF domain-containing protein [Cephalotus follicularis]|uniref:Zf-GRF domain-containing protein n=1 Tax=Cephalotus follicularis TaxID=3775 RepID=A0A1Q3CRW3_CEPFO|nr:zf-GRF domain-containing protein [Cephalotus follicularis]
MESSQQSSNFDIDREENASYCHYRSKSSRKTSLSNDNSGRRFYSCPNYKSSKHCKFFIWYNIEILERANDVMRQQRDIIKFLRKDINNLETEVKELKRMVRDDDMLR